MDHSFFQFIKKRWCGSKSAAEANAAAKKCDLEAWFPGQVRSHVFQSCWSSLSCHVTFIFWTFLLYALHSGNLPRTGLMFQLYRLSVETVKDSIRNDEENERGDGVRPHAQRHYVSRTLLMARSKKVLSDVSPGSMVQTVEFRIERCACFIQY